MTIQNFLETSYTSFHATKNVVDILTKNGFVCLDGQFVSELKTGGRYFCTKNGSAVVAFVLGAEGSPFKIAASHTDSPSLKIKGSQLVVSNGVSRINVEKYGGAILYSFLDRPLKIAGRYFTKSSLGSVQSHLFESKFDVVVPSLAIHHNPSVNDSFSISVQNDMLPILSDGEVCDLYKIIDADAEILDADLFVVPNTVPSLVGVENQFLISPRLDNLTSVYTSIMALVNSKPNQTAVCYCSDNEEIGSLTKQGAHSSFLPDILKRISKCQKSGSFATFVNACQQGFVLSVDNGHAVHPAFPQKSDSSNKVYMNKGIIIKHHPNYATDGLSSAMLKNLLKGSGVAYQDYYNNSDVRCGSTVGGIIAAQLQMTVCDIGLPTLAMHSACEMAGVLDITQMQKCLTAFFNS